MPRRLLLLGIALPDFGCTVGVGILSCLDYVWALVDCILVILLFLLTECHLFRTLPDVLRDATFSACLKDDVTTKRWLTQLLFNITESTQHVQ